MPAPILREVAFMRPPAELGRLRTFADKAVDRPGIDEFPRLLGDRGDLSVPLGNVDDLDAEPLGEHSPFVAAVRDDDVARSSGGDVDQSLLDKMRD